MTATSAAQTCEVQPAHLLTAAPPVPDGALRRPTAMVAQGWWFTVWQTRRHAQLLPLLVVVQSLIAVASVIGFGLLYGDVPPDVARYLVTGAPTATLIMVGLVMTPQSVAGEKQEGSIDWLRTLRVPRLVFLAADLIMWTLIALPGVVLAVVVGSWRYHLGLHPAWWVVGAALLISLTTAAVGYAFACLLPPQGALLVTQLLVFVVMFFSPLYFPVVHLPGWLQGLHQVLPIAPAADLMRAGLDPAHFSASGTGIAVLVAWCAASVGAAAYTLSRRR